MVKLHRVAPLAPAQQCFTFEHPNAAPVPDNSRYVALRFDRPPDAPGALLHGFAGYFAAKLYGDVHLSIYPPTHTPNMFSWFPIFFPLRTPIHVPAVRSVSGRDFSVLRLTLMPCVFTACVQGTSIEAHLWRCGNSAKVWYEWAVAAPAASPVHNPNGRSYYVGL